MDKLKYPIGKFELPKIITTNHIQLWISEIENFPNLLENTLQNIDKQLLNASYRIKGWSIQQIIHHVADSHMHSYIRMKLALTQNNPTINAYEENDWAVLVDANNNEIQTSLNIIKGLHKRWVVFLKSLSEKDLERTFFHPEYNKSFSIKENIGSYAWHGNQHLAHIQLAIQQPVFNVI